MTLSEFEIERRLNDIHCSSGQEPIIITPILDKKDQLGYCGIDLRLGKQFILFSEHTQDIFNPSSNKHIHQYQEEVVVPIKGSIILHPGKLIIGSTMEFVKIPGDIECQVEGRSSWARLGLIVATANTIEPFFAGTITLELSNTGKIPIKLYPGMKIAQLVFHTVSTACKRSDDEKKYQLSIGPGLSKIFRDKHLDYFCQDEPLF